MRCSRCAESLNRCHGAFVQVLVVGSCVGVVDSFLFLLLEDQHGSRELMGVCLAVGCLSETLVLRFSDRLLALLGADLAIHAVLAAFVLQLAAYFTLPSWPSPWLILPVEALHGITYGCMTAASAHKCSLLVPDGVMAQMLVRPTAGRSGFK